jgi:AraC-like DNA-binding protein
MTDSKVQVVRKLLASGTPPPEVAQSLGVFYVCVSEIAYLLSYEDPSSFFRAFHEWEGMTPNEWKAMHRKRNAASVIR